MYYLGGANKKHRLLHPPLDIAPDLVHPVPLVLDAGRAFSLQCFQVVQQLQILPIHLLQLLVIVRELIELLVVRAEVHPDSCVLCVAVFRSGSRHTSMLLLHQRSCGSESLPGTRTTQTELTKRRIRRRRNHHHPNCYQSDDDRRGVLACVYELD